MKIIETAIPEVLIIEPKVFGDARGFFFESYNERDFAKAIGINVRFVQDNHAYSSHNVLRGLHYQIAQPQGKLVRVSLGEVLDVAVDLRPKSTSFGKWESVRLSAQNKRLVWIPPGFAHGYLVLSNFAELLYKTTDYYAPQYERTILWNDSDLAIDWRLSGEPILSTKDQAGKRFRDADLSEL